MCLNLKYFRQDCSGRLKKRIITPNQIEPQNATAITEIAFCLLLFLDSTS